MNLTLQPLVSVVTPVYNSEKYLSECIQSVLAQTYQNWEYVIVNNCSTDRSKEIASKYAEKDQRIRIIDNDSFLNSIENQNNALRKISRDSKYCKILHSDDWLFPNCIEEMVSLCEEHPNVGMVSSYVLSNQRIYGVGLPYTETVVPGSVPCKMWLLENKFIFGNPSSSLIRSDLVTQRENFYDVEFYSSDQITCFELLQNCDFGFIHQILSFMRIHEEQTSIFTNRCNTKTLERLLLLYKFGSIYLDEDSKRKSIDKITKKYYRNNGERINILLRKECWEYHKKCWKVTGLSISRFKLINAVLSASARKILNLGNLVGR